MEQFSQNYLTRVFYDSTRVPLQPKHVKLLHVPIRTYGRYLDIYERSCAMAAALGDVLSDPDHRHLMREAARLAFRLPDIEAAAEDVATYRQFLESFDPYAAEPKKGAHVGLPVRTVENLNHMIHYNCVILSKAFQGVFETEYLEPFRVAHDCGNPYRGPAALREMVGLYTGLLRMRVEEQASSPPAASPARTEWQSWLMARGL